MKVRFLLKAQVSPSSRGLIPVRRMRTVPGRRSHMTTVWIRPEDLQHGDEPIDTSKPDIQYSRKPKEEMVETKLKADAARVWQLYTKSTYGSGDLPMLAVREALQNSRDAIAEAISAGDIRRGRFDVDYDSETGTLTIADNGIGMDRKTLHDVFLTIGGTRKAAGAAGGFGVAKAVILGSSPTADWDIHSRDNFVASEHLDRMVPRSQQTKEAIRGTKITLRGFNGEKKAYSDMAQTFQTIPERLRDVLASCNFSNLDTYLNGERVSAWFPKDGVPNVENYNWGAGAGDVKITSYQRASDSGNGRYYIRINGLLQFVQHAGYNKTLEHDVVIDLAPTVKPDEDGYPLTISREAFKHNGAAEAFSKLRSRFEKNEESVKGVEIIGAESEYGDLAGVAGGLAELFGNKEMVSMLAEMQGFIRTLDAEEAKALGKHVVASTEDKSGYSAAPGVQGGKDEWKHTVKPKPTKEQAAEAIQDFLDEKGVHLDWTTKDKLWDVQHGFGAPKLDPEHIDKIEAKITEALQQGSPSEHMDGQDGIDGIAQVVSMVNAVRALRGGSAPPKPKAPPKNPFGNAAGLAIGPTYDPKAAEKFKRDAKKHVPKLIAWDSTLRLIAREYGITSPFKPGFCLTPEAKGMKASSEGHNYIMVNPDSMEAFIEANRDRPGGSVAIAVSLYNVAAHELAHLEEPWHDHDETFTIRREDIADKTAHMLPAIQHVVERVLKIKPKKRANVKAARDRVEADRSRRAQVSERLNPRPAQVSLFKARRKDEQQQGRGRRDEGQHVQGPARGRQGDDRRGGAAQPRFAVRSAASRVQGKPGSPVDEEGPGARGRVRDGEGGPGQDQPKSLHVHAATVDAKIRKHAKRMEILLEQARDHVERATSPLEREKWRKTVYELEETIGAIRYSSVTGTDSSDLEK